MSDRYVFTAEQLAKRLNEVIGLFIEYRDQHGKPEEESQALALAEVMEGLSYDRELHALDGIPLALQSDPNEPPKWDPKDANE